MHTEHATHNVTEQMIWNTEYGKLNYATYHISFSLPEISNRPLDQFKCQY